jgi:hypothetical protein
MLRRESLKPFDTAEGLFFMSFLLEDGNDLSFGLGANLLSPRDKALLGLTLVGPMFRGHVVGQGAVSVLGRRPRVRRNPTVVIEDFDELLAHLDVDLSFDKPIGHRVVVLRHLNVIVQVDPRTFSGGKHERVGRQE